MMFAQRIIALMALASSSTFAAATACPAPPIVTSDAAVCLAELHTATAASRTYTLKYQAEEHNDYWFVVYGPKESNVRGGGGKLRIDKATGQVTFVEMYR